MGARSQAAVASGVDAERVFASIEAKLGRRLTDPEKVVDVVGNSIALERAKEALQVAIEKELLRVGLAAARGQPERIRVTDRMIRLLNGLYEAGARAAEAEIRALGVEPVRSYVEPNPRIGDVDARLRAMLGGLSIRVEEEAVSATLGEASRAAVAQAVLRIPGARGIAADLVSPAFARGLGATYEQNRELFPGWIYSAMMDGATCDVCRSLDGTEYDSWEAIQVALPNGGPNPRCYGGSRCRCRPVPKPVDPDFVPAGREVPPPDYPPGAVGEIQRARDELPRLSAAETSAIIRNDLDSPLFARSGYPSAKLLAREQAVRDLGRRVAAEVDARVAIPAKKTLEAASRRAAKKYEESFRHVSAVRADVETALLAKRYPGRTLGSLSDAEYDALRRAIEADPRVFAALQRQEKAYGKLAVADAKLGTYDADLALARRQAIGDVLDEAGIAQGGTLAKTSKIESKPVADHYRKKGVVRTGIPAKRAAGEIDEASAFLPTRWVEASNARGPIVPATAPRGFYNDATGFVVLSPTRSVIGRGNPVAIHELGHRVEYTIPEIRAWESVFVTRRTVLSDDPTDRVAKKLRDLSPGNSYRDDEIAYPDKFVEPYIGKVYAGAGRPHEVLSMGLEGVFYGEYGLWDGDPDHRDFVLGILVGVG